MNSKKAAVVSPGAPAPPPPPFQGSIGCAVYLMKSQGPTAFYRGFIPNFARIGSWNIITWVTLEELKALYVEYKNM